MIISTGVSDILHDLAALIKNKFMMHI